jgi:hypothetical protein
MTDTATSNVRLSPPPPRLMRMVNPVVRRVLAVPSLARRFPRQGVLEFAGRRSGRTLRVPVCLHRIDGQTLVFTERPWRNNFRDGATVTVTHRGRVRHGRAVLLDATPEQAGAAFLAALRAGASGFELGLRITPGYQPTLADLASIARSLIRIDFDD